MIHKNVLDKGFVTLLNIAGPTRRADERYDAGDVDPANVARQSFNQRDSGRTYEQEMRLNNYLIRHKHSSPLEMIEVWLELKMPFFVARQWFRHRTHSANEISARYVQLEPDWYIPEVVGGKPESAKQGRDDLGIGAQNRFKINLEDQCEESYKLYKEAIEEGVAPEHARMMLHMNHYATFVWKQNLLNLWKLVELRRASNAQWEINQYAEAVFDILMEVLPDLTESLDKGGQVS